MNWEVEKKNMAYWIEKHAREDGRIEGHADGFTEGIEQGIRKLIKSLKDFGITDEEICKKLQEEYNLTEGEALTYIQK